MVPHSGAEVSTLHGLSFAPAMLDLWLKELVSIPFEVVKGLTLHLFPFASYLEYHLSL
jgi:hypothetical protein